MNTPICLFLIIVTFIFTLAYFLLSPIAVFAYYLFVGLLIWIICEGKTSFIKTLLFWYVAMLINKPEIVNSSVYK